MNTISFFKKCLLALSVVFFVSCDRDFNELDSDIIDGDIHYDLIRYEANVTAYDRATGAVQANNLPLNSLGVYQNPAFGKTTAHFVTQLELATVAPELVDPIIDSVYMYVPYYSQAVSTDAETGITTYTLDSVYGNPEDKIRLSVYENGYFLRDSDPGSSFIDGQRYYSDELNLVEDYKIGQPLNNYTDLAQNQEFTFSSSEVQRRATVGTEDDQIVERLAPGMFMYLDKDYFQAKVLDAGTGNLVNNNIFKDYFRGLYFKVEQIGSQSVMAMPRFNEGKITIIYHEPAAQGEEAEKKTLVLNMAGNTVNFFENEYETAFTSALANANETEGDERLYVKGGEGSMALLDILDAEDLALLKHDETTGNRVLINEANLVFYIDDNDVTGMGQSLNGKQPVEPLRVYLYDIDNARPLYDYYIDLTSNTTNSKLDKTLHGGIIEKNSNNRGNRYKIRITDHIANIVNKDSANVKLGLVVAESINLIGNAGLKSEEEEEPKVVPVTSVVHPFGTILYGSNPAVPEDKRLRLEIFYTKPN